MPELVAAQALLDEIHDEQPDHVHSSDGNVYTLGKMGKHSVVIASLPADEYGTASAAAVAVRILGSFPNVKIGLLVGVGGDAPSATLISGSVN